MSTGAPTITIIGNVTADAELRFTPSGQAVANWTVASTPRYLDKNKNEWMDGDPVFIRCSAWREMAENVAETLTKGMRVIVTGTLKVRLYEAKDGTKGTSVECDVEEVGPSLRWASGKMSRNERQQGGGQQRQQSKPADPWASSNNDEPPPF